MKPHLIVIEGADGTGKTTLVRAVSDALAVSGVASRVIRHAAPETRDPWERALAYAAQRAREAEALRAPSPVVCGRALLSAAVADRWWQSTAVEAYAHPAKSPMRRAFDCLACAEAEALPVPALVVVLDAPDAVLDARLRARGEAIDARDRERRWQYREAIRADVRVDTSGPLAETVAELVDVVRAALAVATESGR